MNDKPTEKDVKMALNHAEQIKNLASNDGDALEDLQKLKILARAYREAQERVKVVDDAYEQQARRMQGIVKQMMTVQDELSTQCAVMRVRMEKLERVAEAAREYLQRPGGHYHHHDTCKGCEQKSHELAEILDALEKRGE